MANDGAPSPPRIPPTSGFEVLDNSYQIDEETWEWYNPDEWYAVQIGEFFHSKYQVVAKLGFGSVSTAWLCRDLVHYVALKVCCTNDPQALNERKVYNHIESITTQNSGIERIRLLRDRFQIPGKAGAHECLVHDPLGLTLGNLRGVCDKRRLPKDLIKVFITNLLTALDFLHNEAGIVHTDIQDGNIMLLLYDDTIFKELERGEWTEPSIRKIDGNRIVYATRAIDIPTNSPGVVLCDFGHARFGQAEYSNEAMPSLYRAPEIVLGIKWNEKIDIWAVGMMLWDLLEGRPLVEGIVADRQESAAAHLARMVALLGLPPKDLLERGTLSGNFFDEDRNWRNFVEIQKTSLEVEESVLNGEEKDLFLKFLRKMLQWRPEERMSAKDLLNDSWLHLLHSGSISS